VFIYAHQQGKANHTKDYMRKKFFTNVNVILLYLFFKMKNQTRNKWLMEN